MAEKSRAYASLSRVSSEESARSEYLAFRLDEEVYAVEIGRIGEILRVPPVTDVPRSPDRIMGVAGVRGRVLSVLDLRQRLGLGQPEPTRHARILVLPWSENESVGLYVDAVLQVYRFAEADIELVAEGLGGDVGDHVIGVARVEGTLVVVIRLEAFLEL
jgi:purine-binding chemotaxis protein CheW